MNVSDTKEMTVRVRVPINSTPSQVALAVGNSLIEVLSVLPVAPNIDMSPRFKVGGVYAMKGAKGLIKINNYYENAKIMNGVDIGELPHVTRSYDLQGRWIARRNPDDSAYDLIPGERPEPERPMADRVEALERHVEQLQTIVIDLQRREIDRVGKNSNP